MSKIQGARNRHLSLRSFVRGDQKKRRDIDILVEFDEKKITSLLKFIEMKR